MEQGPASLDLVLTWKDQAFLDQVLQKELLETLLEKLALTRELVGHSNSHF